MEFQLTFELIAGFVLAAAGALFGRAGTTALYSYLIQHSSIYGTYTENKKNASDIHFFEYMTTTSVSWYKSHFPILSSKMLSKNAGNNVKKKKDRRSSADDDEDDDD